MLLVLGRDVMQSCRSVRLSGEFAALMVVVDECARISLDQPLYSSCSDFIQL
jgi:hypothetical protein